MSTHPDPHTRLPEPLHVVVISGRDPYGGEIAAVVATLLNDYRQPVPRVAYHTYRGPLRPDLAACAAHRTCRPSVVEALASRGLAIHFPIDPLFINPRSVNLWLTLDDPGELCARALIKEHGRGPRGFYRHVFPDPVEKFEGLRLSQWRGSTDAVTAIPDPEPEEFIGNWIDMLALNAREWRNRIWDTFSTSG